jgi:predicted  nucleic acid-binding Zn-ribbon protein
MPHHTEPLAALHKLHLELHGLAEQLARGPRQIKAREQKVAQAEGDLAALKDQLKEFRAAADRKSLDLKSNEAKIVNLRAKLNLATNNREYDVLRGQIEADTVANSVLEDEILELLEKVDRTQHDIHEVEQRVKQLKQERDAFAADFAKTARGLEQQVADLRGRITAAEKFITGDAAPKYHRLIETYGAEGLAAMDKSGVCTNCFVALTAQQKVQVGSGQFFFCASCGRLLYAAT